MSLKTKLVIAATVLALFGAWIWTRVGPGTALSEVGEHAEVALARAEDPRIVPPPIPGSTREEVSDPAGASKQAQTKVAPGAVLVSVVRELERSPVAGVGVQILRPGDVQDFETFDGETDERGALRFDGLRPGIARIASDRGSSLQEIEIRSGETKEMVLTIPSGVEIRGRVLDLERQPVAGASVWLSWPSGRPRSGRLAARADERGKFVLQDIQEDQLVGARAPGHSPSSLRMVDRTSGAIEVELVLPGKGSVVEGCVFDPTGAPVVGARVEVSELRPHPLRFEGTSFAAFPAAAGLGRSDGNGRFRITDAAAGSCEIVVRAKGFAWAHTPLEIPGGGTVQRDIRLSRGASLSGRVLDAGEKPVAGIPLWIVPPADPSPQATIGRSEEYVGSTDSNGRFRVEALPAERTEFVVESDALGRASTSIELSEGIESTWEARLSRGSTVSGRVVDAQGQSLPQWFVNARFGKKQGIREDEVQWLGWHAGTRSEADGGFVLLNCPPDIPLRVAVSSPDKPGQEIAWIDDVKAGAEGVEIRVGDDAQPSAFLIGRVLDAGGRPLGDAGILAHQTLGVSVFLHARTDAVTGKFRVGPLPPGVYRITVQANGQSDLETPPEVLAQGAEVDLGDVRLPESGTVLVHLQSKDGAPAGDVSLSIYGEGRRPVALLTITENIARSHHLPVGSYRLAVHENERVTQQVSFSVSSDHETQLDVMLSVVPR